MTAKPRFIGFSAALALLCVAVVSHAEDKPKYTVAEIMKALNKGEDSVGKRVGKGMGTKADFDTLVAYYSSLPLNEPEQGDPATWKQKATALLEAAKALQSGKDGALAQYNKAADCKACHNVYRPL